MLDHVSIQVSDVAAAARFYAPVFAPVGMTEAMRFGDGDELVVGFAGPDGRPRFWLGPTAGAPAREIHVAFAAAGREAVDAVHEAAMAAGAEILHAPRIFPEYHPGYYAVFVRDPDGNNVEAVHHSF
ncbi:VOC family protein [Pseudonocardia sp. TRM90224]|uniref:VOC family protein n=1 Tax=Pseudonocardia sp. TRM90224 TaxID=2812678 RepID=UPI001E35FC03|nr:VOC family protein [Pseudonocardia sp. TRM90224]